MAATHSNIVAFLLTTYVYYIAIKPKLTFDKVSDQNQYTKFIQGNYTSLAIYLLLIMIIQCIINTNVVNATCGGNFSENIGFAGVLTIWPWTLIFGVLMIILAINPGFKSAFSDVIGYYWIANSSNKIMTELLIDKEIQPKIDADGSLSSEAKKQMQSAADAIIKIFGNTGMIINQVTPRNFEQFWNTLTPLMKNEYKPNNGKLSDETISKRDKLFGLIVSKDNVGEAMWYIYTGLLVTSIVQLKISSKGCKTNVKTMEQKYATFQENEAKVAQKKQTAQTQVYTM
jgi:hypothetical protein